MAGDTEEKLEPVTLFHVCNTPKEHNTNLPPIIFIPGLFSTNRTFNSVKYEISRKTKRKVYVLELRNHGQSEYSKDFSIHHCAADLENFMQSKNISRAVLAGHSMGGRTALAMALKHPDKVEKVIVEDIPLVTSAVQKKEFIKIFLLMKLLQKKLRHIPSNLTEKEAQKKLIPHIEKFLPIFVKNFAKANFKFALPFHKNKEGEFEWEMDIDVLTDCLNHMERLEIDLSCNPVYSGKVLLLAGDKSGFRVQDNLQDYYKHFPETECRIIENGYHAYHAEFPQLYSKLVLKFIEDDSL